MYELDEDGNRIRDANGKYVFNAVPTTDWGSPETLEHWRQTWAELCNAKFAEKGLDVRIDHRSYERQGVDLLPTIHEGATVRAMEKKGIRTEKGEFNRWIKATNAVIRDIKKKIALLFDWIAEAKAAHTEGYGAVRHRGQSQVRSRDRRWACPVLFLQNGRRLYALSELRC